MLIWIQKHFRGIRPVVLDGFLWVLVGIGTAAGPFLSGEDAYKYVNAYVLWWMKFGFLIMGAGAGALKMFRDRAFGRYKDKEEKQDKHEK